MAVENTKQVHDIITKWIEDNTYDDYPADIGFLNFLHSLLCVTELYMEKCKQFEMRPPTIPATGKNGKYYTYGPWHCPRCNAEFPFEYEHKYCPECGQRINWINKRSAELLGRIPPQKK